MGDFMRPTLAELLGRGAPRGPDRDSLEAWGRALGAVLPRPSVVLLEGELGSGKTTLARAVCEGLGVAQLGLVTSPTFSLVQQYDSPAGTVVHADLYRLRTAAELQAIGWDELVASASVLLVEWPERAAGTLPRDAITITLGHDGEEPSRRTMRVSQGPVGTPA